MTEYTIWRGPRVEAEIGFSRSTILRRTREGLFPQPIALSRRSVGWRAQEVAAINAATIRGASEDEIRQLVRDLEHQRRNVFPEESSTRALDSKSGILGQASTSLSQAVRRG